MTDFDLDRLGDVWRQQPDQAEMERLQRTAAAVARRARWGQVIDAGSALLVAAVVILLVSANPAVDTMLMGAAAILVLLVGHSRQRQLRRIELKSLTGGTEEMLQQSLARIDATVKRARFSLLTLPPAIALGWLFMRTVTGAPIRGLVPSPASAPWFRFLWNGGLLVVLALGSIYLILAIRRGKLERGRIATMHDAYREERESIDS